MPLIRLAVTVIAYPAISSKYGESVCVAGLRTDTLFTTEWVRLFPFKVRGPLATPIHKWDEVEIDAVAHSGDHRPESMRPNLSSLSVVGKLSTKNSWAARRAVADLLPVFDSMQDVRSAQEATSTSLAAVRPGDVLDLAITTKSPSEIRDLETRVAAATAQGDLFSVDEPTMPLEVLPHDFHLVVRQPGAHEPERIKLVDWEVGNTWRKWRHLYEDPLDRIRQKWLEDLCGPSRDTIFYVGNMHRFQQQFLLLNVFAPPK